MAQPQLSELQTFIVEHFSREGLNDFCLRYFREVYDEHDGSSIPKSAYARHLLAYCERREFVPHLQAALQQARPQPYARTFDQPAPQPAPADAPTTRNPRQVFLSHAHEDAEFAQRLAKDLREAGLSVDDARQHRARRAMGERD
ncbi:MAG: hypothetical protein HC853_15235 [Anaerolineae bacterium]|nr:hypothetical protein [Anaerolineae bacterium]